TKCPHCGNDILVRTTQEWYPTSILTTQQAGGVDSLKRLGEFGMSLAEARQLERELRARFGREPVLRDVAWGLWNALLQRPDTDRKMVHWCMADQLRREDRDPFP